MARAPRRAEAEGESVEVRFGSFAPLARSSHVRCYSISDI